MNIYAQHDEYGIIYLGVNYPEIGLFDLTTPNEGGLVFSGNNHVGLISYGIYAQPGTDAFFNEGYSTFVDYGGNRARF